MSFYRSCKKCGETISFRQMPAGQWVAFEPGTDTPHLCKNLQGKTSSRKDSVDRYQPTNNEGLNRNRPDRELERWADLPKYLPSQSSIENTLYVKEILHAINGNLRVEIVYSGGETPLAKRVIERKAIFERAGGKYISAYCCLRNDYRVFRFDKITSLSIRDEKQTSTNLTHPKIRQPSYIENDREHMNAKKGSSLDCIIKIVCWGIFFLFMGYLLFN